jgi:hypothetical protein
VITGEHSGLANLIRNLGQVDPPSLDDATADTSGGTLAAGEYVYAVSDQLNTAASGGPRSRGPVGQAHRSLASHRDGHDRLG